MSKTYALAPQGVYWTVNGEGAHTGQQMVFLRLAGCSVGCPECDTNYSVSERVSVATLVERVRSVAPERFHSTQPWVWITGGEPTDQDLQPLMTALQPWRVALAESGHNGQQRYDGLSWRSVSPHRRIEGLYGSEVKLIPRLGSLTWSDVEDHAMWTTNFAYKWVQPLAGSSEEQARCIEFVMRTPGVQMSSQSHLGWNIP